jgi:hypothetical protein
MGANTALPVDRSDRQTLPIQPEPTDWIDSFMPGPWGGVTAVTRHWQPGDTQLCRLCPVCTAAHHLALCQVQVRGTVAAEDLPLLSLHGRDICAAPNHAHDRIVRANHGDAVG